MNQETTLSLCNFKIEDSLSNWYVVNDGVMGGLSKGTITRNAMGHGVFKGYVTTKNNGGFSSIRYSFDEKNVSNFKNLKLQVKGDGKKYQLRIKENQYQRYSFVASFDTTGEWETISIPLNIFKASFRGYNLNVPNYKGLIMEEIAILVGNKKNETFLLEIVEIWLE